MVCFEVRLTRYVFVVHTHIMEKEFKGDRKVGASLLWRAERRLIDVMAPHVPRRVECYHLTLATIPISALIVLFCYLARGNIHWLWASSGMIVLQWLTDSLDGETGIRRGTGLVTWGYYMDHFLDYVFMSSVFIGYALLMPRHYMPHVLILFAIGCGFMMNVYLYFAATNEFRISFMRMGPTEGRIAFVVANTLIIFAGIAFVARALPYIIAVSGAGLIYTVSVVQKRLWKMDMDKKYSRR